MTVRKLHSVSLQQGSKPVNPIRWLRNFARFIRWTGKARREPGSFKMQEDDPTQPDYLDGVTRRRIFISFARSSFDLAKRMESALAEQCIEINPWRYEPADDSTFEDTRSTDNYSAQLERFKRDHPGVAERLEQTLNRCVGYVFIVSNSSMRSAICSFEAFVAGTRFGSERQRAPVWVLLEERGLEPLHLSKFRTCVYQPGNEVALASCIAYELDQLGLDYPSRFR